MSNNCLSFQLGQIQIKEHHEPTIINESRKICQKGDAYTFEYGTQIGQSEILLVGASITPIRNSSDIEKSKYLVHTYINHQPKGEHEYTYSQIMNLFTENDHSQILKATQKLLHTTSPLVQKQIQNKTQKTQPRQKTQPQQKIQKGQKTQRVESQLKLAKGTTKDHVINPETGHEIKIGGPTYEKLCQTGNYIC